MQVLSPLAVLGKLAEKIVRKRSDLRAFLRAAACI
jgi:hypothetical protein